MNLQKQMKEEKFGSNLEPCHRLDRNTAGIVVFGKNLKTLQYLSTVIGDKNKIEKKYLTLVKGHVDESGVITAPLYKKQTHVSVDFQNGKEAITNYKLVRYVGDYSLVEVTLLTGRTHQIRVHFSHIGHPLAGDKKYGAKTNKKIQLISYKLYFDFQTDAGILNYLRGREFQIVDIQVPAQSGAKKTGKRIEKILRKKR